jgi:uncharacterized protein YeaO (DUF488 family)
MVKIKRAYEPRGPRDGYRVLVDRLWPRGIKKTRLALDDWMKEVAPSSELRKRFGHDPENWEAFRNRYVLELRAPDAREKIVELARLGARGTLTLVYGARDTERNNAVVLKDVVDREIARSKAAREAA